jgi:cytosine/adenosine deaminase-related metal-dependent hydrolase
LVAFGVPDAAQPVEDPEAALVFAHAALRVRRVVVAGVSRVREGAVVGFDSATAGRVADAARRVSEWRRAQHAG